MPRREGGSKLNQNGACTVVKSPARPSTVHVLLHSHLQPPYAVCSALFTRIIEQTRGISPQAAALAKVKGGIRFAQFFKRDLSHGDCKG